MANNVFFEVEKKNKWGHATGISFICNGVHMERRAVKNTREKKKSIYTKDKKENFPLTKQITRVSQDTMLVIIAQTPTSCKGTETPHNRERKL